jgi:DNA-binding YbaB/EbfC family protein
VFEGLGNLGNMAKMLKEAGKIKERMEEMQRELAAMTVEGSSGGGMVKVTANGRQEIVSVGIEDEVASDGDREMLEDLVRAAVNAALEKSRDMAREELSKITGGLGIDLPGIT